MAAPRLRKAFHYPTSTSSDEEETTPLDLDEQEQATLIQTLRTQNQTQNRLYKHLLLLLSLPPTLLYIPPLLNRRTPGTTFLISLMSLISLLGSAYTTYSIPLSTTDAKLEGDNNNHGERSRGYDNSNSEAEAISKIRNYARRYIQALNTGICMILGIIALAQVTKNKSTKNNSGNSGSEIREELEVGLLIVPAVILSILTLSRKWMQEVDISSLENLKYQYKGA